jgi:hypothetical protein
MKRQRRTKSRMDSVMKGNTGEFYALAELSRRGWTAAQTARNTRTYDILARKDEQQVAIRVKTKTSDAGGFQWNAKKDGAVFNDIGRNDFCILVDIPESYDEFPQFYIVPTKKVNQWLAEDFKSWLDTPGTIKEQHSADNRHRLMYLDKNEHKISHGYLLKLAQYRAKWELLESREAQH